MSDDDQTRAPETDWFGRLGETERTAVVLGGAFLGVMVVLFVGVSLYQALVAVRAG